MKSAENKKNKILIPAFILLIIIIFVVLFLLIPVGIDQIKGVNYVLTYPGKTHYSQITEEIIEQDFKMMREAGINTIRTYSTMPDFVLDMAEKYDISVIEAVCAPGGWTDFSSVYELKFLKKEAVKNVRKHKARPCIIAWAIWNDAPFTYGSEQGDVIVRYGAEKVNDFLEEIYKAVKKEDPSHPVTGSNMLNSEEGKRIGSGFLDFMSFNTYVGIKNWNGEFDPKLAKEMVETVAELAHEFGKPALVSELGYSSYWTEKSGEEQGKVIEQQLLAVDKKLLGLLVFEWSDDWKKDGEPLKLNNSIEEQWGITTGYREPKGGYKAVKKSFKRDDSFFEWLKKIKGKISGKPAELSFYKIKQGAQVDKAIYKKDAKAKWEYLKHLEKKEDWVTYCMVKERLLEEIIKETADAAVETSGNQKIIKAQFLNWLAHDELMDDKAPVSLEKLESTLVYFARKHKNPGILKEYADLLYEKGECRASRKLSGEYAREVVESYSAKKAIRKLREKGSALLKDRRKEDAGVVLAQYQKLAMSKFNKVEASSLLMSLASIYREERYPEKSIAVLNLLLETYPDCEEADKALYKLAGIYEERKQFRQAEKVYKKLIFTYPESSLAKDSVTKVISIYAKCSPAEKAKKSIPFLEKIVELFKGSTIGMRSQYELASMYEKQKDYDKAVSGYEQIIELYPDSNYADYARKDLSRLTESEAKKEKNN